MIDQLLNHILTPRLHWIQVGVTSHCMHTGPFALAQLHGDAWRREHMSLDLFRQRLVPAIRRAQMAHLQGWGEPFLHPEIMEFFALACRTGARVTTATLDPEALRPEMLQELVRLGVFSVTVPMAGLTEETNTRRRGSSLAAAVAVLKALREEKARRGTTHPLVHVLYTLHRSGLGELEKLPAFLDALGVDAAIVSPLTFTAFPEQDDEALVPEDPDEFDELDRLLLQAARTADARGMGFHYFLMQGGRQPTGCIENVGGACFVGPGGAVSPCIFMQIPVDGPANVRFHGKELEAPSRVFGSLWHSPLGPIWGEGRYKRFRRQFARGRLPEPCDSCWRPYLTPR